MIVLIPALQQGTVYSAATPFAADQTAVDARGLLSDQDIADATKSLTMTLEASFDGGLTYSSQASTPWVGGTLDRSGNPASPQLQSSWAGSTVIPSHVRVRLDLPAVLSIGAELIFP